MALLGLDLRGADAKIDRAQEHLDLLKTEVPRVIDERHPHTIRGEVVEDGWCVLWLHLNESREPRVSAIAGDYIHNLRSALNYIVTALVDATPGLALGTMHQFPASNDPTIYANTTWRPGERVGRGVLSGITPGLPMIERLQPYHTQPDPGADPLYQLNRFSNADKHREIFGFMPTLEPGTVDIIVPETATVIETTQPSQPNRVGDDYEIGRIRFAPPYPTQIRAEAKLAVTPLFSVEPFGNDPHGMALDLPTFAHIGEHVRLITDLFKTI